MSEEFPNWELTPISKYNGIKDLFSLLLFVVLEKLFSKKEKKSKLKFFVS
jgi:hypothetical protein